jgi:hypothetical protein
MASATVKNGTSAIEVVKVRLLAVRPMWSSRKRSRSVSAVWRHGKVERPSKKVLQVLLKFHPRYHATDTPGTR